jgi:hypothetical protein
MTILASAAARMLLQAVAAHDTVFMRQLPPVRGWFEQVVFVASGISTLLVLLLVAALVVAMLAVRRSVQRAHEALDRRVAEFGHRLDDFNELLRTVHRKADALVEVGGMAVDGLKWGAKKVSEHRAAADTATSPGTGTGTSTGTSTGMQDDGPAADDDRESPYLDSRASGT